MIYYAIDYETTYHKKYCSAALQGPWVYGGLTEAYMVSIVGTDGLEYVGPPEDAPWDYVLHQEAEWVSHNRTFDRSIHDHLDLDMPTRWHCSADLASYIGAPRSLAKISELIYDQEMSKGIRDNMEGRHPDDLTPEEMEDLENYALEDSRVCLRFWLDHHDSWPEHERRLSEHTTLMAHRGIELDLEKCEAAKDVFTRRLHDIRQTIPWANETTGVRVKKPVPLLSPKRLNQLCNSRDVVPPPSLRKDNESLEMWKDHAPDDLVSIVEAFQDYKSVNRTLEVVKSAEARRIGTRCFPTLIYHEAGTGRWAGGSGLNMQNLTTRLIAGVNLRNIFTAKPGHVLLVCDLSQIEPRLLLWDVGDTHQLNMIREGMDPYEAHARATMRYDDPRPLKDVDNRLRKLAKARVLGLGYGLGASTFVTVARTNGIDLTYGEAQREVDAYRRSNDRISSYWYSTDRDFKQAAGGDYFMYLASGRVIAYRNVRYNIEGYYQAETQLGRPKPFYGGKLVQNRTQAHGRDVLGPMILEAESRVGHVVNHVHDEIAVEVPIEHVEEKKAELEKIMTTPPEWAGDLPLGCECKILTHFDK